MATFAPTATPRYTVQYVSAGRTHSMTFRFARGTLAADIVAAGRAAANGFASALDSLLPEDFAFLSATYSLEDSELSFPALVPAPVTGGVPLSSISKQDSISSLTFPARGALGSKYRLGIYGLSWNPDVNPDGVPSDFLVKRTESGPVNSAFNALEAATSLRAIDNSTLTWGQRATLKVNDHWLGKVRQGA